ncbi:ABC transporter ATP-binding protein [Sneathia sanguinegens]|uniref:ABC transporter ATP-binding protein n=1 Tax=Sneathia sanguinegens TaxID=40543 RepID=UPI000829571A|nr:ABC transporter ATP-binding protein [Sneathia sanguinegens]MDU4651904.1 ABC transporter ATP-binding protein [Sneathia sanguinegens]MDU7496710.1 ABC transporter ATP-binding protein [Sneathia sanguinegens]
MLKVCKLYKKYGNVIANNDINFQINDGEFVIILGPSGAGKSTLLNILGGIDVATSGDIIIDDKIISKMSENSLTKYRRNYVGFVFQFYNLMPNLTALENVELASELVKDSMDAKEILEQVGLRERLHNFPQELSGGEQQRVAIARAIAKKPKILLCDEPTGALDYKTGKQILKLLHKICRETKTIVIVITHNRAIAPMADRIIEINDAKVKNEYVNTNIIPIEEIEW